MANSMDPDQTAPIVYSWSTRFAYKLNSSVMLGKYLQQTTSADHRSIKMSNLAWIATLRHAISQAYCLYCLKMQTCKITQNALS